MEMRKWRKEEVKEGKKEAERGRARARVREK